MKQSKTIWYFAYGSNMDPAQMKERGISITEARKALLKNFRLAFNLPVVKCGGSGVADVIPSPGSVVEGVLYAVSEDDLKKLDYYEGVAGGVYERKEVIVSNEKGLKQYAILYQVINKSVEFIAPSKEYLSKLIRGSEAHHLKRSYINRLKNIPTADE